ALWRQKLFPGSVKAAVVTMTSAARKSSAAEYLIPTHARAGFFTREFLARKTRCGSVESSNPQTKQWQPLPALPDGKGWPLMFANDGDEPGAGRAGAHRSVRKNGDGGSNTPNQPLAQINPSPAQTNAAIAARAILNKALELGIHVGVSPDGCE